jgi:hypothetical protein
MQSQRKWCIKQMKNTRGAEEETLAGRHGGVKNEGAAAKGSATSEALLHVHRERLAVRVI